MSRRPSLYSRKALGRWTDEVSEAFPNLTKPQAAGLANWSFGMVLARCCALSSVALFLAKLLGQQVNTLRQRLREFYQEADAKRGPGRQDLDVTTCFAPLLRWVLRDWPTRDVPVALDASALGSLFVVLCISVVYRGSAIPVAWKILPANVKGSWRRPWLGLLRTFRGQMDDGWKVVVLADRGLYARWLFNAIRKLGWHPMLRVNLGGKFRPAYSRHFVPLASLVPHVGSCWRGRGTAFVTKGKQLRCTLLAYWGQGHAEPWLLLTDLDPQGSDAAWYALRSWIEQFFKDCKRGGWQWQRTRMTDPARAQRLWLAVAVATLWLVRVGGADDAAEQAALPQLAALVEVPERPRVRRWRLVSVFARGWGEIVVALINHRRLPLGRMVPQPWPTIPDLPPPAGPQTRRQRAA
jgi:hypothetical protein